MATKQKPRRGSRERTQPTPQSWLSDNVARAFDGHGGDVAGLLLISAGLVAGLGIYADVAGPVGRAVDHAGGVLIGVLRYLLPVALVLVGGLLVRGRVDEGDGPGVRPVLGALLLLVSVAGLAHLAADPPPLSQGIDAWTGAGGLVGGAAAEPARRVMGLWGCSIVLFAVGLIALTMLMGSSLRGVGAGAASRLSPTWRSLRGVATSLFRVGDDTGDVDVESSGSGRDVRLFDQDAHNDPEPAPTASRVRSGTGYPHADKPGITLPLQDELVEGEQLNIDLGPAGEESAWKLPSLKLLSRTGAQHVDEREIEQKGQLLEAALAEHGVETRLVGMVVGPTVTRYELELGVGVKVNRVTSLHKDIAYAMASPDVRILAPIPGRQAIGVEVPNVRRQLVKLADILASEEAHRAVHPLEVAVGRDINGKAVMVNLATMPHLLIAGQTGAGKSSCINSILTSILMRATPEHVRLILIDPKRVELTHYNRIPHLLTQVVTNPKKAANALGWVVKEMERRYDVLSEVGVRDITGYNAAYDRGELRPQLGEDTEYHRLPFILVVVDELSDLMMVAARDVEDSICRLAQMARAVGIHLVIATQRPSVNVITGVIKANVPARLAFSVSSATDSKVILDQSGAERLVGQGDMLLLGPASSSPHRIQGAWVDEKEINAVVKAWRSQAPTVDYVAGVEGEDDSSTGSGGSPVGDDDELLSEAMDLVVRSQLGSTSMLQRKLRVGFARAGRLMDLLEQRGVVGPSEGSKARAVLMTPEELDEIYESGLG